MGAARRSRRPRQRLRQFHGLHNRGTRSSCQSHSYARISVSIEHIRNGTGRGPKRCHRSTVRSDIVERSGRTVGIRNLRRHAGDRREHLDLSEMQPLNDRLPDANVAPDRTGRERHDRGCSDLTGELHRRHARLCPRRGEGGGKTGGACGDREGVRRHHDPQVAGTAQTTRVGSIPQPDRVDRGRCPKVDLPPALFKVGVEHRPGGIAVDTRRDPVVAERGGPLKGHGGQAGRFAKRDIRRRGRGGRRRSHQSVDRGRSRATGVERR